MGKKKGKANSSSEGQPQGPAQQRPQSQQQGPAQQQPQQQGSGQQRPQPQQQGPGQQRPQQQGPGQQRPQSQQQAQSQQQSAQKKPRPKTGDQPKKDDTKASSSSQGKPAAWTPEFAWGQQTQSQSTQSVGQPAPSAWGQPAPSAWGQPAPSAWGQPAPSASGQPAPSAWGQQRQLEQTPFQQSVAQSQAPLSAQQNPARGRPRPKTEEQPQNVATKASHQQQSGSQAWVPEYAFSPSGMSANQSTDKPQSQAPRARPTEQHSGGASAASSISEGIDKLSISNVSTVSSKSSASSVIATAALIPLTKHKGSGKMGRPVRVDVNFLPLLIDKLIPTVYQYDVTIEPNLPKRMLPFIFERFRENNFPNIFVAFDGQKIAVSPKILPTATRRETEVTNENGRVCTYMVAIKEARDCNIDFSSLKNYTTMRQYDTPLRALQMMEIVLKSPFWNKNGVQAGRSFYMRPAPNNQYDLGDNYELWTGLYQATVLGSRPYLNVDIAHKAFPSELPILELINRNADRRRDLDPRDRSALQTHLNGLMIKYETPGNQTSARNFKFLGLNANSRTHRFKSDQDNREYTIEEYFRSRNITIQFPMLPTLKLGNAIKNITVPMEFCSVAGSQAVNKKCTETQTRNMIKVAATSTDVRKSKIMDMLQRIAHNQSPTLQQFGIQVGSGFTNVPARVLPPPTLEYNNEKTVIPSKGVWRADNLPFFLPQSITRYAVLIMDRFVQDSAVRPFCDSIYRHGRSNGMKIDTQYDTYRVDPFSRSIRDDLRREMSKMIDKNIELLFCIIPDRGDTYSKVKQCAELECGILTQCIKQFTLTKKGTDPSTVSNILLKVNAKLNGTNHKMTKGTLPVPMRKPFMLIGADVTHPSPGQEHIPSVVGVVSSHDFYGFQYNKCWRLQDPKQEVISDFENILVEHLKYFEEKRNRLPETILYFRDGVSEGQFQQVLSVELNALYRGCQQYKQNYKPKITFIVVQKRHHTRFFPPPNSKLGQDDRKNNNVPAGTIVDSEITHPNENQFYLVSHQSIQGVARPTKYCLLRDDSSFDIDDLQAMTYDLCHFFARCTRSVSYPAPTYYAHLAAARGRVYIEGKNINMNRLDREFQNCTVKQNISKGHPMYFI